jgi:sugar lactone lactonase YvrE
VHLFIHTVFAFDHDGNLWVMNTYELKTVVMYTPEQLDLGGSPTPAVTLDFAPIITGFLRHFAFDGDGNMWVQLFGEGILRVPAAQLAVSGAPEPDATVEGATFGGSASESIAFDHGGDLWVVLHGPDGIGRIANPASLEGSVTPPLEVVIASALSDLRQIAFAPAPPDLPIWAP